MERIRAAIQKARETRTGVAAPAAGPQSAPSAAPVGQPKTKTWDALEVFRPRLDLMAKNRIVTFDQKDNAHVPFDMMRTRVLSACRKNKWTVIGVTSPTASCGKTVTSINLAFSFARQKDARTVLIDADLRRPMVAEDLGVTATHSMGRFLSGGERVEDHFLAYGDTLAIGTNNRRSLHAAEILQDAKATDAMKLLKDTLRPTVVIVDMPPMMATDDVVAFMPNVDAMLLVVAAGQSKIKDIDDCERELAERTNVMGVVLNKCRFVPDNYYYKYD